MSFLLTIITGLSGEQLNEGKMNLMLSGEESHVIRSYDEANEFHLGQNIYRSILAEYYTGKKPDNTFIRYRTPWSNYFFRENLFEKYNWKELTITVSKKNLEMIKGNINNELIVENILDNATDRMQKMTPRFVHSFENTFSVKWTKERSLAKAIGLGFSLGMSESSFSGNFAFTDTYSFGYDESKTSSERISIESGGMFEVPANTCTKVAMYGKSAKIKAVIEYEVTLSGNMVVTYDKPYNGHYYWAIEINNFLNYLKIPNKRNINQEIELSYLFNTYNKISDLTENECKEYRKSKGFKSGTVAKILK